MAFQEGEGRFSRWSRLKQTRQAKKAVSDKKVRGRAMPVALAEAAVQEGVPASLPDLDIPPTIVAGQALPHPEIAGPFKPWMPPLDVRHSPDEALSSSAPAGSAGSEKTTTDEADGQADMREEDYDLPPIDSLTPESDFTPFMKEGVPDILKRKAMRKLWSSNPVLANLDGLNEYDEDYTLIGTVVEEIASRYKVGKGMVWDEDDEDDGDLVGDVTDVAEDPREARNADNPDFVEARSSHAPDEDEQAQGGLEQDERPAAVTAVKSRGRAAPIADG